MPANRRFRGGRRQRWLWLALFLAAALAFAVYGPRSEVPTVASLERQLSGHHCRFEPTHDGCRLRPFSVMDLLFRETAECEASAVRCLGTLRGSDVVPALTRVLETHADVETCDGVIPVRSVAVDLLGEMGDASALAALQRLRETHPRMKLSPGATGCQARPEGTEAIDRAISRLQK